MPYVLVAFRADAVEPNPVEVPAGLVWGIALVCVIAALILALAVGRHGGRHRELQRLAAVHGLVYSSADPAGLSDLRFPTFAAARGVAIRDVLTLRTARSDVRAFDFALWDEYERGRTSRDQLDGLADDLFGFDTPAPTDTQRAYSAPRSGAVVRVDAFLPPCTIRPVSWASRTFEAIGLADLDFESDEFNRGWDVRCTDRRFASLFVDAQLIDLILSLDEKVGVETFGNYVLLTADLCRPARQVQLLHSAARVPELLSPLVIEEYPTALTMYARAATDEWRQRPDGLGGLF